MQKPIVPIAIDFSLEDDEDPKTIFKIRSLTGKEHLEVIYQSGKGDEPGAMVTAIKCGLTGWENFGDAEFSDDPEENAEKLNYEQLTDISGEILRLTRLEPDDKKKSK